VRDPRLFTSPRSKFIQARIRGDAGRTKRVSTGCIDEKAASLWADEEERRRANPRHAAASAATLGTCVRDWLAEQARRKNAQPTIEKEETRAGHFVRIWGPEFRMALLDARKVEEYIARRENGTEDEEGVAQVTVHDELGTLKGILKVAAHHGLWRGVIAEVMPVAYARKARRVDRAPTPEEVAKLLAQLRQDRAAHVAYIVATGSRISETFKARRDDVVLDRSILHIHGTKTRLADDDIAITSITRPWLEFALKNAPGKDVLFLPWGKYWRDIVAACRRAEIPKVTPNDLRRSFGTWHRLAGANVSDVARLLRHGDDKLAQTTYARIGGEEHGIVVERQLTQGGRDVRRDGNEAGAGRDAGREASEPGTGAPGRLVGGVGKGRVLPVRGTVGAHGDPGGEDSATREHPEGGTKPLRRDAADPGAGGLVLGTSDLHHRVRSKAQKAPQPAPLPTAAEHDSHGKTGRNSGTPDLIRTDDLSFRKASDNARSLAGKQAWERRRVPTGTSNLHRCAVCGRDSVVPRVFKLVGHSFLRVA
jgi:integrase